MSDMTMRWRSILLTAALVFGASPCTALLADGDAREEAGEPVYRRIVVIGASASAGFNTTGFAGRTVTLARVFEAMVREEHDEIVSAATPLFFLQPFVAGQQSVEIATKARPTMLSAVDFLFWYGYGTKQREADRLKDLDKGLALLDGFSCPILISTIPDMSAAVGKMLRRDQVPKPATLKELNARIEAWAKKRPRVALIPLVQFLDDVKANRRIEVADSAWPAGTTRGLLQWDRLHPMPDGMAALGVVAIDAFLRQQPGVPRDAFELDAKIVVQKIRDGITAERRAAAGGPAKKKGPLDTSRRKVDPARNGLGAVDLDPEDVKWDFDSVGSMLTDWQFDPVEGRRILARNKSSLAAFHRSLEFEEFQVPEPESIVLSEATTRRFAAWARLGLVVAVRALELESKGDVNAAARELLALARFGQRVQSAQGREILWNTGYGLRRSALSFLRRVMSSRHATERTLELVQIQLARLGSSRVSLRHAFAVEYGLQRGALEKLAEVDEREARELYKSMCYYGPFEALEKRGWRDASHLDLRQTGLIVRRVFELQILEIDAPERGSARLAQEQRRISQALFDDAAPNGTGTYLCAMVLTRGSSGLKSHLDDFDVRATRVVAALCRYERGHGKLPQRLDELVPKLLDRVPRDPFVPSRPLSFAPKLRRVYSFGDSFEDLGGIAIVERGDDGELVPLEDSSLFNLIDQPRLRIPDWNGQRKTN